MSEVVSALARLAEAHPDEYAALISAPHAESAGVE